MSGLEGGGELERRGGLEGELGWIRGYAILLSQEGQLQRLQSLLTRLPSSVNARCPSSGDTPLIAAVREGHMDVVKLLLKFSADVTAQNDSDESALDVATEAMRKVLLGTGNLRGAILGNEVPYSG